MNIEKAIGDILKKSELTISTVESCTGGLLSSRLTDVSGSSAYINFNLVTYSNKVKHDVLGVSQYVLETFGAVSQECAYEMAEKLYELTEADICVSVTGIAGPTGGTKYKPVGTMYSTIYTPTRFKNYKITVDPKLPRKEIKKQFTDDVLRNILYFLSK